MTDQDVMSFGKHKGKKMADVPTDYLVWWLRDHNRDGLKIDAEFGNFMVKRVAVKKLKLYDYIQQRLCGPTK